MWSLELRSAAVGVGGRAVLGPRWRGVCVGARGVVLFEADDPPVWAPWLAPHGPWWWGAEQAAGERFEVARAQQLLGWAEGGHLGGDRERVLLVSLKCLLKRSKHDRAF
jgi:hypothetical protein